MAIKLEDYLAKLPKGERENIEKRGKEIIEVYNERKNQHLAKQEGSDVRST